MHRVRLLFDPLPIVYFLCLGPVGWRCNDPSPDYSGEVEGRWSVDRSVFNVRAMGSGYAWSREQLACWKTWAVPCRGTRCVHERRVGLFLASSQIQRLKVDVSRWAKHSLSANAVRPFVTFLCPVTFQGLGKNCIGTSDGLRFGSSLWVARLDGRGDPLPLELGARIELLKQFRVFAHLAACTKRVASSRLWASEQAEQTCPIVLDAVVAWKKLVLLDVGYVVDNVLPPSQGEKCVVFLAILAVARILIWTTRKKGLYDDANFSHRDLVLYFRHQLRVKIRCDKTIGPHNIRQKVGECSKPGRTKVTVLESSFLPLPAHGVHGTGPSGPHPG